MRRLKPVGTQVEPRAPVFGLDVVRAAAVSLVLASHCGDMFAKWFHTHNPRLISYGAYYGIELFFVLSGFLIGRILIGLASGPRRGGLRAWRVFMLRRWLRTLPAYYVCLAALALLWAPMLGLTGRPLAFTLAAFAAMLQNLFWPMVYGNFFDVTWSLAVEEWFYLCFSALLLLLARLARLPVVAAVAIVPFVAGPIIGRAVAGWPAAGTDHELVFWLDSIAVGVMTAVVAARFPGGFRAAAWLLPVCLGLAVLSLHGGLARIGVGGRWSRLLDPDFLALLLALSLPAACRWRHARGPAAGVVRAVSGTSYSLYLVHLSVLNLVDARRVAWHLTAIGCAAASIAIIAGSAWVLNRLIERPFMAMRPQPG